MMSRLCWSATNSREEQIQLCEKQTSDYEYSGRSISVSKAAIEDGILQLLATAAEMQQRQDLESANQLYEAAMTKMKAHGMNHNKFLTGTKKKPPPLNRRTAIEWCVHVSDIQSAVTLLGDPNVALTQLMPTLNTEQFQKLFRAGANIEHRVGPDGRTFLHRQAFAGQPRGVELALNYGANVSNMDDNGDSALSLALRSRSPDAERTVSLLLEAGADVNSKDGQGLPIIRVAATHASLETVKEVIKRMKPLTSTHHQDMQAYVANLPSDRKNLDIGTSGVIQILLENGLDPNTRCQQGNMSLLDLMLRQSNTAFHKVVLALLERRACVHLEPAFSHAQPESLKVVLSRLVPSPKALTAFIMEWSQKTISQGKTSSPRDREVLGILLDFGLSPDLRSDKPPHTPLILFATKNGDIRLVEKLVAHKADVSATNDGFDLAIVSAVEQRNRALYNVLMAGGADESIFFRLYHLNPDTVPWID